MDYKNEIIKILDEELFIAGEYYADESIEGFKYAAERIVKLFAIPDVSVSLPTKDKVCAEGYRIANNAGYNYRRVLSDQDHDIYYSGWMDCFDWISKKQ